MDTIITQFIYFAFFLGLLILMVSGTSRKISKPANFWFTILVFLLVLALAGRVLYLSGVMNSDPRFLIIPDISLMTFGPAMALFTQSALIERKFKLSDSLHFIPGSIHVVILIIAFISWSQEETVSQFESSETIAYTLLFTGIGIIISVFYWVRSWKSYQNAIDIQKNNYSHWIKSGFVKIFLLLIAGMILLWSIIFINALFEFRFLDRSWNILTWLGISFTVFILGFFVLREPELINSLQEAENKYKNSSLSSGDLERLKKELDLLMQSKKPYLKPRLMKQDLSAMLGVNPPDLSRLLSEGFGMNFFEYVNYYRIQEFITLINSGEKANLTYIAIAEDAGFNSKATFNRAFKEVTGKTPTQYFKK